MYHPGSRDFFFFWGTGTPTKSLIKQPLCYHMAKTLWALSQENVHNTLPWKESDTRISPLSILIFLSRQLKAGSGILWGNSYFFYIPLWILFGQVHILESYSWQNSEFSSHLPLHKFFQIFMFIFNSLSRCVKKSNRGEKWSFSLSF